MNTAPQRTLAHLGLARRIVLPAMAATALSLMGCQSQHTTTRAANPALRTIQTPAGGTAADADRAALSRFVGDWRFDGWSTYPGEAHRPVSGRAAGVIDSQHFVLIDFQATSGQLGGNSARKSGSFLLGSEPGVGMTLTGWGDASPSCNRMVGRTEGNASAFCFHELRTPPDRHRLALTIVFETDNKFTAEVRDDTASGTPVIASYTFTRAPM